ncbi:MAG: hypothetical protein QOD92_2288 [Acidimicrobiaceae bacterium]
MPGTSAAQLLERSPHDHAPVQHPTAPSEERRIGGLDGLRAVAVLAVVAYHLWPDALPAGFLGVDLFMVLSGFLITGLLIDERARTGGVRLGAFWMRRFRRLVPALLAVLVGVALWVRIAGPALIRPTVRGQGLASLLYVGNWKLVHDGTTYGALASGQSPLLHLWSLAIEEQFYVIWPPVVVGLLFLARGRRRPLALFALAGALVSAALMAAWFEPGHDPLRLYYGTDTRAQAFLIGAVAVIAVRRFGAALLQKIAVPAFVLMLALFALEDATGTLYRGGFAGFALVAAVVVAAVTEPGPLARLLDRGPLRLIGRVSYGIYLWHWPVIVLITDDTTPLRGITLLLFRAALIAGATAISWLLIERPYRRAPGRRAVPLAAGGIALAAVCLLTLPSQHVVAYADVDVTTIPTPVVAPPAFSGVGLQSVMVIGDSGMYDVTPALTASFTSVGAQVISTAFAGEGLTTPPGVRDSWATTIDQYRPDLVVVMLGAWDYDWIADHGDAAYQAEVDATVKMLSARGARIVWLSVLPGDAVLPGRRVQATELDRFYSALPARFPGVVEYVDIATPLANARGDVRKPDGWHLCPDGAAAIASAVITELGIDAPTLTTGSWRADGRFDDPPGGCPG